MIEKRWPCSAAAQRAASVMPMTGTSASSFSAGMPGSPNAATTTPSTGSRMLAMISATAPAAMSDSKRVSMYSNPCGAVSTTSSVPVPAERRASARISAVTSELMLGLTTSEFHGRSFVATECRRRARTVSGYCSRYFRDVRRGLLGRAIRVAAGDGGVADRGVPGRVPAGRARGGTASASGLGAVPSAVRRKSLSAMAVVTSSWNSLLARWASAEPPARKRSAVHRGARQPLEVLVGGAGRRQAAGQDLQATDVRRRGRRRLRGSALTTSEPREARLRG